MAGAAPVFGGVMIVGIDVSNNNGAIDWRKVAADRLDVSFAFVKASEGLTFSDADYHKNRTNARVNGIAVGAYHYGHPSNDPEDEAERFLRIANVKVGDLRPCLDIEEEDGHNALHVRQWVLAFCNHVAVRSGVRPFVYTSPAFAQRNGFAAVPALRRFPLWVAHWKVSQPTIPPPWKTATVWQRTSDGHVDGIAGRVDVNVWLDECDPLGCWKVRLG